MFGIGPIIKGVTDFAGKFVTDRTKKLQFDTELARIALQHAHEGNMTEFRDIENSRRAWSRELQRAPWVSRLLNGLVRPVGGLGAISTLFWVIWAPYFGYRQIEMPKMDWNNPAWVMLSGIISFYFVLRHQAQIKGVKDK